VNRTVITDATLVTPQGVVADFVLVVSPDSGDIVAVGPAGRAVASDAVVVPLPGRTIVPGFIDVHVHGVAGTDVLDGDGAVARVASRVPEWGVTAFAPTTIACAPERLAALFDEIDRLRSLRPAGAARVLAAHLESNFISPEFAGAQPLEAIRSPDHTSHDGYSGADVLRVIEAHPNAVGIVTLAPERPGGMALVRDFVHRGIRVSVGHSGASFEDAMAAFAEGASRATHLFNAMPVLSHRAPGAVGAALAHLDVTVELIADGVHVHPTVLRLAIGAKPADRVVAISDGTAASGLPPGSRTTLGGRPIVAADAARLENGALAGSVATMDRVFRVLVEQCGLSLPDAVRLCATNPARDGGLAKAGTLAPGQLADFVVLNSTLHVEQTWIAGRRVWIREYRV
jgi:N-acetylglucosamine-6-phosphate deacetylase